MPPFKTPNTSLILIRLPHFLQHRINWHIGFWMLTFSLYLVPRPYPIQQVIATHPTIEYWVVGSRFLALMLLVYSATFFSIPYLLYRNHILRFGLVSIAQCLLISWILIRVSGYIFGQYNITDQKALQFLRYAFPYYPTYSFRDVVFNGIGILLLLISITGLKYIKDTLLMQQRHADEMQRKMEQEAMFLRQQLSPHFFFNTLNNLYGLAITKSEKLPQAMLQLSDLLRYTLYETKTHFAQLSHEIAFLNAYLDLEQLRLGQRYHVSIEMPENVPSNLHIAPLMLIVFVENAFKHTRTLYDQEIQINVHLSLSENILDFSVENTASSHSTPPSTGIGLENVQRRLDLLYPQKHELHIQQANELFRIHLHLDLT